LIQVEEEELLASLSSPKDCLRFIIANTDIMINVFQEVCRFRQSQGSLYDGLGKTGCEYVSLTATVGPYGIRTSLLKQLDVLVKNAHKNDPCGPGRFPEEDIQLKGLLSQKIMDLSDIILDGYVCQLKSIDQTSERYRVVHKCYEADRLSCLKPLLAAKQYERAASLAEKYEDFDTEHSLEDEAHDGKGIFRTEYTIRGKKHSASLAQWREGVKCPHCIYIGHSATRLEQHLARVHEEDTTYKCRLCDFTCKWNREYYKHMKTHFEGPPYKCQDCDYTCDRIQFILSHRMRHTDERPFHCELCSFKSRTKGNLIVHMRIHTGEKPYKCQYCGRCFAMKNTLDQHLATHRDDRPFLCDTCGFTTKYQSHLLSHKRIHTGNVFHCQQQGCSYFSPRRSQLAAHMRSHLSIRSHICSTCGRGFIEKSHLIRHERIHLDEKPFKCDLCDYGSTRRDKLKEHVIKHHSGDNSNKTPYKPRKPKKQNSVTIVEEGSLPTVGEECQLIVTSSPQDVQISQNEQEVATANLIYEYSSSGLTVGHTRVVIQSAITDYADNMILN